LGGLVALQPNWRVLNQRGEHARAGNEDRSGTLTRVTDSSYGISYDVEAVHLPHLMKLFASAWWTTERTEAETRGILAGSDVVVTVVDRPAERLVGFARVLTDRTYLAVVLDVIVAAEVRGEGVGAMVMNAVLAHPWVAGVRSVELVCQPDLVAFYERWGFTQRVGRSRLMRRTTDASLTDQALGD
jgi:GNAT superfamily N-acetyltransferase